MKQRLLAASAAAALLAGCGGSPESTEATAATSAPVIRSAPTPIQNTATGTLVVTQQGSTPNRTLWYLRVEDLTARTLIERSYTEPIALTKGFPAGQYRVIVWHRACENACPTTGEEGLGPLEQVCGAKIALTAAATVKAAAVIGADRNCIIKVE